MAQKRAPRNSMPERAVGLVRRAGGQARMADIARALYPDGHPTQGYSPIRRAARLGLLRIIDMPGGYKVVELGDGASPGRLTTSMSVVATVCDGGGRMALHAVAEALGPDGLAAVATALREGLVRAERGDGALMLVLGGAA